MPLSLLHSFLFDIFLALIILIFAGLTFIASHREKDDLVFSRYQGKALFIVPCRGRDFTLEENLRAIIQSVGNRYGVVAVVDSEDDEAVPAIKSAGMKYIVASPVCTRCSGKVRAVYSALVAFPGYAVYAIADSDILPATSWAEDLLSPFTMEDTGISTTFPYFFPRGGFWSVVKLVWGFVGLGMMESSVTRFGWGGSLAFRSSLLDGSGKDFFLSYVSDDVALTKLCKSKGYKIRYVRSAAPVINSPDDFSTFMEWANRQTALSIYSTPSVFRFGVIFYGSTVLIEAASVVLSILVFPAFVLLLAPVLITALRNVQRAGRMPVAVFLITLFIPFLYLYNLIRARKMSEIRWRGRTYSLGNEDKPA